MADTNTEMLDALIIGSGFAGLGMAVALRQAGETRFLILEKGGDVGGVWRDNAYPGAACDVPSHLYSFSFEPKPDWSRSFATQPEILDYLRHCADKYDLRRHLRLHTEVREAAWDEAAQGWTVTLADGEHLRARQLITAVGQLSRPALPNIPGLADFAGPRFHSAQWDHGVALEGQRVAVIGTGASAIQFVPAIAPRVAQLSVFQRSAAYVLPRPDRPYSAAEQSAMRRQPWRMRLRRLGIYLHYESQALAFTRFKGLMRWAVGVPFQRLLQRQVPDAALRQRLTPDYPIGCKRILLSSTYLATLARPNVALVTEGIRRITPAGVETVDGRLHPADVLVYGTGFAATEFLAPMRFTGRDGRTLGDAWREGAAAYLGLTVPGFPNLFTLYGPNTNLGHNSIVYMLESQIAHVMRCRRAMQQAGATALEVDPGRFGRFNRWVQRRLTATVWNGCRSWYIDARGHNPTNWPGFTLSFRAWTRWSSLSAYRLSRPLAKAPGQPGLPGAVELREPASRTEALVAAGLRSLLRHSFRLLVGPPLNAPLQRAVARALTLTMFAGGGVQRRQERVGAVPVEVLSPPGRSEATDGAILYLHGGAFCLGGPATHRSLSSRLAPAAQCPVWVVDYRLAPEHPYPAGLDDALAVWRALRARGLPAGRIVIAGDSAGGALALALALRLKALGEAPAAGLLLLSPVTDLRPEGSPTNPAQRDPMLRPGWLTQALRWYAAPADAPEHRPLSQDLAGLPPLFIQVGEEEILRGHALALARHAQACGLPVQLEVHARRWHVFQLQAGYLASAAAAVQALGQASQRFMAQAAPATAPAIPDESPAPWPTTPQAAAS